MSTRHRWVNLGVAKGGLGEISWCRICGTLRDFNVFTHYFKPGTRGAQEYGTGFYSRERKKMPPCERPKP